ncbi:MAG: tRNA (adenosine(37)-N6)-threonylcarbamoyltransferase complex transferase subunit TsaD [Christensenellales bacterium]|nr:tRNA (adenosine(37)-N6)-threonylcarbamoyltransferase complex transferase subunit TsaD [Christensenellales bacterium]
MNYEQSAKAQAARLQAAGHATILAIESSCDETAAAVVRDGREVVSSVIASQIPLHAMYGGVVPEIASRKHVESVNPVVDECLSKAGMTLADVDAIAVTYGPGLVGALLIGVSAAKALAYAADKPLIPVNHIEGHVSANYIAHPDLQPPFVCLVASGGHSHIVRVDDYGVYTLLGQTMDDAAGEAFDKAARVLGLPYPGGPLLDKLSREGNPYALKLPHVQTPGRYDYSFSGLKTALINTVHKLRQNGQDVPAADIAASFQHAAVELLSEKAVLAAKESGSSVMALAGGVASNSGLRNTMNDKCQRAGLRLVMPPPILCTDNAAMIGSAGFYRLMRGETAGLDLNACPSLRLV